MGFKIMTIILLMFVLETLFNQDEFITYITTVCICMEPLHNYSLISKKYISFTYSNYGSILERDRQRHVGLILAIWSIFNNNNKDLPKQ